MTTPTFDTNCNVWLTIEIGADAIDIGMTKCAHLSLDENYVVLIL